MGKGLITMEEFIREFLLCLKHKASVSGADSQLTVQDLYAIVEITRRNLENKGECDAK
jgi:hypothetical protein